MFSAPTVSAAGVLPGEMMPPTTGRPSASLAEVAGRRGHHDRPASIARCTAWHSGSSRYDSNTGWPSERLMTRMFDCAWWSIAQSIAAMTSLVSPEPSAPSTLQADDVRARRDAGVPAVVAARDDAGDVRAVAELVAPVVARLAGEVHAATTAARAPCAARRPSRSPPRRCRGR